MAMVVAQWEERLVMGDNVGGTNGGDGEEGNAFGTMRGQQVVAMATWTEEEDGRWPAVDWILGGEATNRKVVGNGLGRRCLGMTRRDEGCREAAVLSKGWLTAMMEMGMVAIMARDGESLMIVDDSIQGR